MNNLSYRDKWKMLCYLFLKTWGLDVSFSFDNNATEIWHGGNKLVNKNLG